MKIKSLAVGMMACAALVACSNNDLVDDNNGNQPLEGEAYVAVAITNPNNTFGRATAGDEEVGTAEENKVENATFVFFDANGNHITNVKIGNDELKLNEKNQTSEAVLVLNNASIEPTSVVAFLNAPEELNINQPLSSLLTDAGQYGYNANGNFVMSNSVFKNVQNNTIQVATPISGHIKESAEEAMKDPLDIYVERVLSKVTVTDETSKGTIATETTINGEQVTLEPRVVGWILNGTNNEAYILKNVDENITAEWAWGTNRSFWAKDVNYTTTNLEDLTFRSYNEANTNNKNDNYYCLENTLTNYDRTQPNYTHLLVVAQIHDKKTNKDLGTFCSYNGQYYTENDLKTQFAAGLKKEDGSDVEARDIEFVEAGTSGNQAYMAKAEFKDEVQVSDDTKTALTSKGKFMMYTEGKCYFWTAIEHIGPADKTGSVGVVRNHAYALTLKTISGLGTPVVDPTEPIIPETPSDDNSYLAAQVHILPWKMVSQNVDLK
jgi:hypothetical protein